MPDENSHHVYPALTATDCIMNPWYILPETPEVVTFGTGSRFSSEQRRQITRPCRVELEPIPLTLFIVDNRIVLYGSSTAVGQFAEPLRNFISFRSFVDYSLVGADVFDPQATTFEPANLIQYQISRWVRHRLTRHVAGREREGIVMDTRETKLEVKAAELQGYLRVLNGPLYDAVVYYLRGCHNHRYFLIEYYKAVETIKKELGGDKKFMSCLGQFGIRRDHYAKFLALCNEHGSIGRHSPRPDAPSRIMDLANLLVEPDSRSVFVRATCFCRRTILGYLSYMLKVRSVSSDPQP